MELKEEILAYFFEGVRNTKNSYWKNRRNKQSG